MSTFLVLRSQVSIKLIESLNQATAAIDCWDEYAVTRRVHKKNAMGVCTAVPQPDPSYRNSMHKFPNNE